MPESFGVRKFFAVKILAKIKEKKCFFHFAMAKRSSQRFRRCFCLHDLPILLIIEERTIIGCIHMLPKTVWAIVRGYLEEFYSSK